MLNDIRTVYYSIYSIVFGNNSFIMILTTFRLQIANLNLKDVRVKVTIFVFVCRI